MGFTPDDTGKPVYDDNNDPLPDLQAATDYADRIGGLLKGTSTQRLAMTASQVKTGWIFYETDTEVHYLRKASGWEVLMHGDMSYTPTLSRAGVGNGFMESWYSRVGNRVSAVGRLVLGTTSTMEAASGFNTLGVSVPVPMAAFYGAPGTNYILGIASYLDVGSAVYDGMVVSQASSSEVKLFAKSGSPVAASPVSSTAPHTFASGDVLTWSFTYQAA